VVLTGAGTLAYLLPMSAIAGIGILLSTPFNAWQGILREPTDWEPIVRSAWVCALYAVPAAFWALTVFLRRDVTGG
jgi:ABC-2 type transport system permease protein